jgi:hypothetical protein
LRIEPVLGCFLHDLKLDLKMSGTIPSFTSQNIGKPLSAVKYEPQKGFKSKYNKEIWTA